MGLERHAGKRGQRRFLKLVQAVFDRLVTAQDSQLKPLTCQILVYGKRDARMRRTRIEVGRGAIRRQQTD
jgi:hypothetical protein